MGTTLNSDPKTSMADLPFSSPRCSTQRQWHAGDRLRETLFVMEWPEIGGAYAGFCRAGDEFIRGGGPGLYERGQRGQRRLSAETCGLQRWTAENDNSGNDNQFTAARTKRKHDRAPGLFLYAIAEGSAWAQRQQNLGNASLASQAAATQLSSGGFVAVTAIRKRTGPRSIKRQAI